MLQRISILALLLLLSTQNACTTLLDDIKDKDQNVLFRESTDNSFGKFVGLVVPKTQQDQSSGVRIERVLRKSPAEVAGLIKDDIILAVDNKAVNSAAELLRAVKVATKLKGRIKLTTRRPKSKRLQSYELDLVAEEDYRKLANQSIRLYEDKTEWPLLLYISKEFKADNQDLLAYLGYTNFTENPTVYSGFIAFIYFKWESASVWTDRIRFMFCGWPFRFDFGGDQDEEWIAARTQFLQKYLRF